MAGERTSIETTERQTSFRLIDFMFRLGLPKHKGIV